MPGSFAERWAQKEREFGCEARPSGMVTFRGDVLPAEAGPMLNFDAAACPVFEYFGPADDWSEQDRARLEGFLVIGIDGAGNPFCVEESTGHVVLLDHEDSFHTREFVNSSVRQLAECLLAYFGDVGESSNEERAANFQAAVRAIDPAAAAEDAFWSWEVGSLAAGF